MNSYENFVDGSWQPGSLDIRSVEDPSTGEAIATVQMSGADDVDVAVRAARRAFDEGPWRRMGPLDRAGVLSRVADELQLEFDSIESALVGDTGCPVRICSFLQLAGAIGHLQQFGDLAPRIAEPVSFPISENGGFGQLEVHREPFGVVAGFSPFNFPLMVSVWKVAPALLAGNTVVLKPSPLTPVGADALVRAFERAGLPNGVLNLVQGDQEAGDSLVRHRGVDLVTFTGSTAVGRAVMAGAATAPKAVLLELGGKSPSIILDDADAELAVRGTLFGCMIHAGQACAGTTRLLVPESRYEEVRELLERRASVISVGSAADAGSDIGPLVSARQADAVEGFVNRAVSEGATILVGGSRPSGLPNGGHYFAPTVLVDVRPEMEVAQQEIFGPVLSVIRYASIDEACEIANGTSYGLAASVWGKDLRRAREVAARIDAGTVWINDFAVSDVRRSPFGGRKQSGIGAEFGIEGLHAYSRPKSLYTSLDQDIDERPYALVGSNWD